MERPRDDGFIAVQIDHIFVLAGGKGTRSADPRIPKFCQKINDQDVAFFLLRALDQIPEAEVTWVLGEHAEAVLDRIGARADEDRILLNQVSGTANALRAAASNLGDGKVLVLLGDTVISLPLSKILRRLPEQGDTCFFGRFSDHAWDSDHLVLGRGGEITQFVPKSEGGGSNGLALALSGATVTTTRVLSTLGEGDAQHEIYLATERLGGSTSYVNSSWFIRDAGTKDRIQRISDQHTDGSLDRRGAELRPAVFIDRDGTLVPDIGECRSSVSSDEIPERVRGAIGRLNRLGIPIFLVTNQPGIAKGCIDEMQVLRTFQDISHWLAEEGSFIDAFYFCPHHPDAGWEGEVSSLKISCDCRKPGAGMLLSAASQHMIDLTSSVVIGDTARDEGAAVEAGASFSKVSWSESGDEVANAIEAFAREVIQARPLP